MEKMEYPKLNRCPFCGYKADLTVEDGEAYIECENDHCHARGPSYICTDYDGSNNTLWAVMMAVNSWNDRRNGKWEEDMKPEKTVTDHEEIRKLIRRSAIASNILDRKEEEK